MGTHVYDMVPQFSTVYYVFRQIWSYIFYALHSLSRYHFNIMNYPDMLRICRPNLMKFKDG